jgi:hypothetical protein
LRSTFAITLAVLAVSAGAFACSGSDKLAVKSVVLSKSVKEETVGSGDKRYTAGPATTVFGSNDPINAVVEVGGTGSNPQVRVVFTVVDAGEDSDQEIDHVEKTLDRTHTQIYAVLKPSQPWPAGSYRIDVLLNDQIAKSIPYSVQ